MRCVRRFLPSVVLVVLSVSPAHADDVDDFVKAVMEQRHIPAVSIAVIKGGALVKSAGYGLANVEHEASARSDTVYKIGSVSKQFIAAAVMLLAQDGKLLIDDKASKYLAGVPDTWQDITIRRLLTHTSGLAREAPGFDPYKIQPDIDVIKSAYSLQLQFQPGEKYDYSNLGYYVLAEIVSRVSGTPWHEFLHRRVFAPLGMSATQTTNVNALIPKRASGYIWRENSLNNADNWTTLRPSGAFLSTVLDMAKWEAALQAGRVLSETSKAEMWKPLKFNDGREFPYGFGWELDDFPPGGFVTGVPMIRHEGTIPGFRAAYGRLPKQGVSVIVLSNLDRAQLDSIVAGIAVRFAPDLMPAALKRWDRKALGFDDPVPARR
jgi:CubicO group peptidase (beta-lactamase class C family)